MDAEPDNAARWVPRLGDQDPKASAARVGPKSLGRSHEGGADILLPYPSSWRSSPRCRQQQPDPEAGQADRPMHQMKGTRGHCEPQGSPPGREAKEREVEEGAQQE